MEAFGETTAAGVNTININKIKAHAQVKLIIFHLINLE